jgi:hypothetical protein
MNTDIREVLREARKRSGQEFATVASCVLRIGAWLKSQGLPVDTVAEAVDRCAPTIEEVVAGRPKALLVVAVDKKGVSLLATEDDAEVQGFADHVCEAGGAILGLNPARIAAELAEEEATNAPAVH